MRRQRRALADRSGEAPVDLTTRIGSVTLPNPVMTASGTAGHGAELQPYVDLAGLGAVVVKSLAAFPWAGNPAPRLHPTTAGMLNAVGLQGPGVEAWLQDDLPPLLRTGARVVASIWGRSVEEYRAAAELLATAPTAVVAVEVNLSCPNLEDRRHMFAHSPAATRAAMEATAGCRRPRWAKLSPTTPELPEVAAAARDGGAEAVTLVNTLLGMVLDPVDRPSGARRRRGWAVGSGHPARRRAGGLRRPGRPSRTCPSSASAGWRPGPTRSSCCWPARRRSRWARRRSSIRGRRLGSWASCRRGAPGPAYRALVDVVGAAHRGGLP